MVGFISEWKTAKRLIGVFILLSRVPQRNEKVASMVWFHAVWSLDDAAPHQRKPSEWV